MTTSIVRPNYEFAYTNERFHNWCFVQWDIVPSPDLEKIIYMVYQPEICPTTGRLHYQGYVEFKEKFSIKKVRKIFKDPKLWLGHRLGSQKQAIDYSTKLDTRAGDPVVFGKPKNQGHRKDLDEIYDDIEEGLTCKEILLRHKGNALRHINCIRKGLMVFYDLCPIDMVIKSRRDPLFVTIGEIRDSAMMRVEESKLEGMLN